MIQIPTKCTYRKGKTEFQVFFSFFMDSISSQFFFYKTMRKNDFFSRKCWSGNRKKGALVFFDSVSGDKNRDYRTNWIEYESHLILQSVSSDFHSFFCDFHTVFLAHPINPKALVVFCIFQGLIHIFKDNFTKFQGNSRTKGTFLNSRSFPGPRLNSRTFPGLCKPVHNKDAFPFTACGVTKFKTEFGSFLFWPFFF